MPRSGRAEAQPDPFGPDVVVTHRHTLVGRGGRIDLCMSDEPAVLMARPSGFVGVGLVRRDLRAAHRFALAHPQGWRYVVDTTMVRGANPLNVAILRRIPRLPNLRGYVVVAPGRLGRLLLGCAAPLVGADAVLARSPCIVRDDDRPPPAA